MKKKRRIKERKDSAVLAWAPEQIVMLFTKMENIRKRANLYGKTIQ